MKPIWQNTGDRLCTPFEVSELIESLQNQMDDLCLLHDASNEQEAKEEVFKLGIIIAKLRAELNQIKDN